MKILFYALLLTLSSNSYALDLEGTWRGEEYDITLSETFNDIEGHWGQIEYDLDISEDFQDIEGKINALVVNIDISNTFKDVEGSLPCGKVDYEYSLTFKEVEGIICGQKFEINLENEEEVIPTAQAVLLDEILSHFPTPTRSTVERFILSRIHF